MLFATSLPTDWRHLTKPSLFRSDKTVVIDVEYEDVIDLKTYREKRDSETRELISKTTGFELMYSKRDKQYIKVPRDIAEFIRYIKQRDERIK